MTEMADAGQLLGAGIGEGRCVLGRRVLGPLAAGRRGVRINPGRALGDATHRAERHRGHDPVAVRADPGRPDPHVPLLVQQDVMQADPQGQQSQRRHGEVDGKQDDVRKHGVVGVAETDLHDQGVHQRKDRMGEPAAAEPVPRRLHSAAPM